MQIPRAPTIRDVERVIMTIPIQILLFTMLSNVVKQPWIKTIKIDWSTQAFHLNKYCGVLNISGI